MSYNPSDTKIFGQDAIEALYWLLMAKYANSSIASSDPGQFKLKVFMTIFEYAPAWKGRLQIQEQLFKLNPGDATDMESISEGSVQFNNHAANPNTEPTTGSFDQLPGINAQNTSGQKRGILENYAALNNLLLTDVTEEFLGRFKPLFLKVVMPQKPLWYGPVEGDDSTEDVPDINSSLYGNYRTNTFRQIWPDTKESTGYQKFLADYSNCGIPTTI